MARFQTLAAAACSIALLSLSLAASAAVPPASAHRFTLESADATLKALHEALANNLPLPERVATTYPTSSAQSSRLPFTLTPDAVCGPDTSRLSTFSGVCKVLVQASGGIFACSGWAIGPNIVALAGHCVVDKSSKSGYIAAAAVGCAGSTQAISAISLAVMPSYIANIKNGGSRVFHSDGAVLKLNTALPAAVRKWVFQDKACAAGTIIQATVAGYPTVNAPTKPGKCHYTGKAQWASTGPLACAQDSQGFYRTQVDSCGGGSGSIMFNSQNIALGIFTAEEVTNTGACNYNLAVRILDYKVGTTFGCRAGKGVCLRALMKAVNTP